MVHRKNKDVNELCAGEHEAKTISAHWFLPAHATNSTVVVRHYGTYREKPIHDRSHDIFLRGRNHKDELYKNCTNILFEG